MLVCTLNDFLFFFFIQGNIYVCLGVTAEIRAKLSDVYIGGVSVSIWAFPPYAIFTVRVCVIDLHESKYCVYIVICIVGY